jgi:hypothetical protein
VHGSASFGDKILGATRTRVARFASTAAASIVLLGGFSAPGVAAASGRAARTTSVRESAALRLTSRQGSTINERGSALGTFSGTVYVHLHFASSTKLTAEMNVYPGSSSLSGSGSVSYHVSHGEDLFDGALTITRGTGVYAHVHASRLALIGVVQRRDYGLSVELSGTLSF